MPIQRWHLSVVIHHEDIQRAGVSDVNAAIRKIGGVYGRQSLDGSPDFSLTCAASAPIAARIW
jgi:hypothetical protein